MVLGDASKKHRMALTTQEHLARALAAHAEPENPRVGEITRAAIKHLYAFVEEVGLTREEWAQGIEFLTAIGQLCDDRRQEFILLSDTLGVSMLVEMVNQQAATGSTEPTVLGPFHVDRAPRRAMGDSILVDPDPQDKALVIRGVVTDLAGSPIGGATLDVWQTASNGLYDVQDDAQTPMNLRGVYTTGMDGRYEIRTVRPVAYPIPDDGPVGTMLHLNGRHNWRPAHVHFVVEARGHKRVVTHLFDADSSYLDSDAVFGVRDSLVVEMAGGDVVFDFALEPLDEPS